MTELHSAKIETQADLEDFLMAVDGALECEGAENPRDSSVVYVQTAIRLTLVKERLTDGSHVFNIHTALVL